MTEIIERLKIAAKTSTDTELANKLGISQQSITSARTKKSVPASWIPKAAQLFDVSTDWLFFGRGPMHPGEPEEQPKQQHVTPQTPEPCPRCAKLEAKVDALEAERRELSAELRAVNAENRRLGNELIELTKEKVFNQGLQRKEEASPLDEHQNIPSSNRIAALP